MKLAIDQELQRSIERRVRSGRYASAEDVLRAAMLTLEQSERFGDFEVGELDRLLIEGEKSIRTGGTIAAASVFKSIRAKSGRLKSGRRRAKSA